MTRILMVCLGNICRSPLAEGILKSKLPEQSFVVDSAGTGDYHIGGLPDHRSIAIARQNNIDITNQRARQFSRSDFDAFDHIYVMDQSNFQNVINLARDTVDKSKVKLIMDMLDSAISDVPDPYFGGENGFVTVFEMLDQACEKIASTLLND
ncbi:MAG: low molecular weight phosphotyrosine protein phosphatase [Flavobacteriaceae bacterium]|nr:low molecular weight phosphotyrosine protein phosphatase [Flavobacteriaceae bacterium]